MSTSAFGRFASSFQGQPYITAIRWRLLLQIHDELLFEVSPEDAEALTKLVRDEMTTVAELKVPLKVDVALGATWADV